MAQQQIQELGQSLEAYHAHNSDYLEQIRNANEMCQSGNAQDAASILYVCLFCELKDLMPFKAIMSRSDRTTEDTENYAVMTYKMQALGENLYKKLSEGGAPQLGNMDMNQVGGSRQEGYHKTQGSRNVAVKQILDLMFNKLTELFRGLWRKLERKISWWRFRKQ